MPTERAPQPSAARVLDRIEAVVFDVQRGSMVDGPGLRTTVFLKGCPLRCAWCHNPQSMKRRPETVIDSQGRPRTYGQTVTVTEIMEIVRKDRPYYETSGGGLTISGGEPMDSHAFTRALAEAAHAEGIHVAIDTSGFGTRGQWEALVPCVNLVLFDLKITDDATHLRMTTAPLKPLLETLRWLGRQDVRLLLRCPVIPTVNDHYGHFAAICGIARELENLDGIDLLPYHDTARYLYDQLGRESPPAFPVPDEQARRSWLEHLRQGGVEVPIRVAS